MLARAPASAANLGPAFDTLALALDRYVEVEINPSERLVVRSEGEGADLAQGATHLAAQVAIDVKGHDRMAITVRSEIPVARGLGSSAALAVAAAAAAGARDPLAVAAHHDGHPENAAASRVGGLVAATMVRGTVRVARMPLDPALQVVAVVPGRSLPTARARQALPTRVSREDAVFNIGRTALLLAGLADHRILTREATDDRLHQDYRTPLFPEAPQLLAALFDGGALSACWSGAGPTIIGFTTSDRVTALERSAERALDRTGLPGQVAVLRPDGAGLVAGDGARLPSRRGGWAEPEDVEDAPADEGPAVPGRPGRSTRSVPGSVASGRPREVFDFDHH